MGIALCAVLMGLALGKLSQGRILRLSDARTFPAHWLALAFLAQGAARGRLPGFLGVEYGLIVWGAICVVVIAVLLVGLRSSARTKSLSLSGALLVVLGMAANVLVVLANGSMPVIASAPLSSVAAAGPFYSLTTEATIAPWAGDVLAVRLGSFDMLLSVGDILLLVGVVVWILEVMLGASECGEVRTIDVNSARR